MPPRADRPPVDIPVHDPALPEERTADGERLRLVMRHVAATVTVVTAAAEGEVRGATIGSFTSLSLTPPLISFNVIRGTNFHGVLRRARSFVVHVLRDDQADLAEHFAGPDLTPEEQFDGIEEVAQEASSVAPPVLDGALVVLWCQPWEIVPAGDHDVFIGRVVDVRASESAGQPLIYHDRAYKGVGQPR